ncbi:MAG TPA: methionine--tRNA ligase [Buchnera sp. (in: enterobacteria)]|nr:methionine--tRNA ligase [Buchnera sp. (in: enterobacteria)]
MNFVSKKILVTCALPYANGPIHIGHLLEHIQADIWVRYNRMRGHTVFFICADDAHGTAIMLQAKRKNISPETLIENTIQNHKNDFLNFHISYDHYHSTHSEDNFYFLKKIFFILQEKGYIKERVISQLYDSKEKIFLPDRFVQGLCPVCKSINQYGDNCEFCGATYDAINLIEPKSVLSNTIPIIRDSMHLFFNLPKFSNMLEKWILSGVLSKNIINKTKEWFKCGLKEWNISRDRPYFGFKIPNYPNKYFYVWLDATIGYISTFSHFCKSRTDITFKEFWDKDSSTELYHFIGKDIIYFHSLFWPAILESIGFRKPTKIFVHGYIMMNGVKLSKSKNCFIIASNWLKYYNADSLRYYYASKLSSGIQDIEININQFVQKFNADVIHKVINLASRSAGFINKQFNNKLSKKLDNMTLYMDFIFVSKEIEKFFDNRNFSLAMKKIMQVSDIANKYINDKKPWTLNITQHDELHMICSLSINFFRVIMTWLKPVMPRLAEKVEYFLKITLTWQGIYEPLLDHEINEFQVLYKKINVYELNF